MGQEFICYFRFLVVLDKHLIVSLSVLDKMDKSYVCLYVLSVCVHELLCLSRVLCLLLCMWCPYVCKSREVTSVMFVVCMWCPYVCKSQDFYSSHKHMVLVLFSCSIYEDFIHKAFYLQSLLLSFSPNKFHSLIPFFSSKKTFYNVIDKQSPSSQLNTDFVEHIWRKFGRDGDNN